MAEFKIIDASLSMLLECTSCGQLVRTLATNEKVWCSECDVYSSVAVDDNGRSIIDMFVAMISNWVNFRKLEMPKTTPVLGPQLDWKSTKNGDYPTPGAAILIAVENQIRQGHYSHSLAFEIVDGWLLPSQLEDVIWAYNLPNDSGEVQKEVPKKLTATNAKITISSAVEMSDVERIGAMIAKKYGVDNNDS
jgi:hypothetical protein